jgi:methionine-rich copper-binding protein CopC
MKNNRPNVVNNINNNQNQTQQNQKFTNEKKTANFEKSIPTQGETIPAPPTSVLIQTNSASNSQGSTVTINMNNQDYGTGDTLVGTNGMTLRRNMDANAPDGIYSVNYKTCGSDGNCQQGSFQFEIAKNNTQDYDDQRNKSAVTVVIANGKIYPENLLISKGTKLTIINTSTSAATLNSSVNGVANYYSNFNGSLTANGNYTFTFGQTGYYPYSLKVGEDTLNGKIVVQ